ncbi:hypothetical protein [Pantoea ananatis]|uniref:hypothetical protein n=1 Tax=Pantoea ananas TaxID=553 RepID=UPI0019081F46|nr:hypothetical protein [Pantoea ananatis]
MHRIDTPTAQVDKFGPGKNGFTGGNPQTGELPTALNADFFDSIQEELCAPVEAAGLAVDKANRGQLLAALKLLFLEPENALSEIKALGSESQNNAIGNLGVRNVLSGVIGTARNLAISVTAASATATVKADEVILGTALGGSQYRVASLNKTINLGTTGAGGMDTGTAPANGFVAIYAIYNPVSGASALLGANATSVKAPEVYGGANMPSGFTASALLSVWPVNNVSGQFAVGLQADRAIYIVPKSALNTTSTSVALTSLSIAAIVPMNARVVNVACGVVESAAGNGVSLSVAGSSTQIGIVGVEAAVSGQTASNQLTVKIPMALPQTIYYLTNANSATRTISVYGYDF